MTLFRPHVHLPVEKFWDFGPCVLEAGLGLEIKLSAAWLEEAAPDGKVEGLLRNHAGRVSVHAPFEDMAPLSRDQKIRMVSRERLETALQFALRARSWAIVYHTSYEPLKHEWRREDFLNEAAAYFAELAQIAQGEAVQVNLENVFETDPSVLREIIDRASQTHSADLGWCFDLGHYNFLSQVPLSRWFDELLPLLRQAHMHVNHGKTDEHLPLGSCGINVMEIIRHFPQEMVFTLENHEEDHVLASLAFLKENQLLIPDVGTLGPFPRQT